MFIVYQHFQIICQFLLHECQIKPSSASSHSCPRIQTENCYGTKITTKNKTERQVRPRRTHIHTCECREHYKIAALEGWGSTLSGKAVTSLYTSGYCLNFVSWACVWFFISTRGKNLNSQKSDFWNKHR